MKRIKISRPCLFAAMIVFPATVWAQTAPADVADTSDTTSSVGVTDIVVTAQKKSESLQNVPVAVTAVSGEDLAARGITNAQAFASLVPNMTFSDSYSQIRIAIRGVGFQDLATQGGEPRVAYHVDGNYISMPSDIGGTFYDINRVEVNRGPQGTLFGRNAVAGTVNVITNDPTDTLSGYLNADVGNYSKANVEGAISGPLGGGFSARVAFQTRHRSGYEYNIPNHVDINNQNTQAFRAKLKYDGASNFTAVLSAEYYRERDRTGPVYFGSLVPEYAATTPDPEAFLALYTDGNPRHNFDGFLPYTKRTVYGFGLNMTLDLGDDYTLSSLTGYRNTKNSYFNDNGNGTDNPILSSNNEFVKQYSQELRLQKEFSRGSVAVGGYFFGQEYTNLSSNPFLASIFGLTPDPDVTYPAPFGYTATGPYAQGIEIYGNLNTRAFALFGEATYKLTDTTTLIVGGRYSTETKKLKNHYFALVTDAFYDPNWTYNGPLDFDSVKFSNFSPRVTLQQQLGDHQMVYLTFSKGFKTGGFNLASTLLPAYLPETVTNYEAGFKADAFDRRLRLNGAVFYYNYDDMQQTGAVGQEFVNYITNAAKSRLYGAEVELTAVPVEGLQFDLAGALLRSKFTGSFSSPNQLGVVLDVAGNPLPNAPRYTLNYGVQYTFDTGIGSFTLRGEGTSKARVYFDVFKNPLMSERASTVLNASLGWKNADGNLSASIYVKNITNGLYRNGSNTVAAPFANFAINGSYDPPRTFGATMGVKF